VPDDAPEADKLIAARPLPPGMDWNARIQLRAGRIEVWQGDRMLGTLDRRAVQVELLRHMAERAAAAGKLLP
jgi:hypothetical protein